MFDTGSAFVAVGTGCGTCMTLHRTDHKAAVKRGRESFTDARFGFPAERLPESTREHNAGGLHADRTVIVLLFCGGHRRRVCQITSPHVVMVAGPPPGGTGAGRGSVSGNGTTEASGNYSVSAVPTPRSQATDPPSRRAFGPSNGRRPTPPHQATRLTPA